MAKGDAETAGVNLGSYLSSIRADRGLTLREVEASTGNEVSNAYLSQIERGVIAKPSARVLGALAEVYRIDNVHLLELAGYVSPARREPLSRRGRTSALAEHNLTPEEEVAMLEYLRWYRHQNRPKR
ncbi:helix-turn-helix transcriptional regulator [Bradyrhizobium sp. NAS96.2]|uniref:helix-turn-helix domain-containing protein n=1 Tax=Bradyrhizobium sp. NAS96.2 TaxID=1680160 RepID=UPI00093DDC52|nr:helix-turn-helix transcriptional regulator [Bradyrhizobium sp. NAS96.2]